MSLATKMAASKLIHYFSSHPAAFVFQSSTPPNNISLTSANRKADQSLSEFQTGIGAATHAALDTEQLISHLRLPLLILFPLYPILRETLYLCPECMNASQSSLPSGQCCVQMSCKLSLYFSTCLVLFPGSTVRSGLHRSLFFTVSRM